MKKCTYQINEKYLTYLADLYAYICPILNFERIGKELVLTLRAQDFIFLLDKAKLLHQNWCKRCGSKKIYKDGYTRKLKQQYVCANCNKKWHSPIFYKNT